MHVKPTPKKNRVGRERHPWGDVWKHSNSADLVG